MIVAAEEAAHEREQRDVERAQPERGVRGQRSVVDAFEVIGSASTAAIAVPVGGGWAGGGEELVTDSVRGLAIAGSTTPLGELDADGPGAPVGKELDRRFANRVPRPVGGPRSTTTAKR